MGAVDDGVSLAIRNWCEQYGLVDLFERDVPQMLLIDATLLLEDFRDFSVFDAKPVRPRSTTGQGSCVPMSHVQLWPLVAVYV